MFYLIIGKIYKFKPNLKLIVYRKWVGSLDKTIIIIILLVLDASWGEKNVFQYYYS